MSYAALLMHRVTIRRSSETVTKGEVVLTEGDAATDVPCLIQEGAGRVMGTQSGQWLEYSAVVFFAADADVRPNAQHQRPDAILVTSHPLASMVGSRFLIVKAGDEAGTGHHIEAYAMRVPSNSAE